MNKTPIITTFKRILLWVLVGTWAVPILFAILGCAAILNPGWGGHGFNREDDPLFIAIDEWCYKKLDLFFT